MSKSPQRRNVLKILWIGLGLVALGEFIMVILSFFLSPLKKKPNNTVKRLIDAGSTETLEKGSVTAFVMGQFYLVCLEDGGLLALSSRCTHLGCALPWDKKEQKFICPCHASQFDIKGDILSSPAPRALDLFKIHLVNKNIQVDINGRIERRRFNKNQLVYPENLALLKKASEK